MACHNQLKPRRQFLLAMSAVPPALQGALAAREQAPGARKTASKASFLPAAYYRWMSDSASRIRARLDENPAAGLRELETNQTWVHFPYALIAMAVLYARRHPANHDFQDRSILALALRIGDLLAAEDEAGRFAPRLDSYRDAYMWLEAYRLLEPQLGDARARRWRGCLERNIGALAPDTAAWKDFPSYGGVFIGTSINHLAFWSAALFLAGKTFGHEDWKASGATVLRRLAETEQDQDGFWGEHNPQGPTIGYNYLTALAVGVYYEHTRDAVALEALRRATTFHEFCTYPDGNAAELLNDRNRYWEVSPWAHFAFSNFPDGRGYAELLSRHIPADNMDMDTLGNIAQNALYYHDGAVALCPPSTPAYTHRIGKATGIRKSGPWVVVLCGLIDTPLPLSQWFLERQSHVSLFHEKTGLIISGANSKNQPELATLRERTAGAVYNLPIGSRLVMGTSEDRLAVAHHRFTCDIVATHPQQDQTRLEFQIAGRGPVPDEAHLTLQLHVQPGVPLETGTGLSVIPGAERIELGPDALAGCVRHHGWTLQTDPDAKLIWPVFPYNPYRNGPETKLERAVATLTVPIRLKAMREHYVRPGEQIIAVTVTVK